MSYLRSNLTFDSGSRVTQITDPINSSLQGAYGYDALDRLTSVQKGNPTSNTIQYGYDAVGNRLSEHTDIGLTSLTYGTATNRLETMAGDVDTGYLAGATNVSFTYNNANRLVQVVADGITVGSYSINALGQRVQKVADGATTQFVYDEAGHLLGEYDGSGNLIQETVWLEDLPIATLRPTGAGSPPPITVYYVHSDHLGAPRAVSRPSDNVFVWRWDNVDAFGKNAPNENPAGVGVFKYNFRFPGQYFDSETGTHYNYFRDYDPSIGRYVESDPIGWKGGLNTYAYVSANPLGFVDVDGQMKLPNNPSGLGPDWSRDPNHLDPNGGRWVHPGGDYLDWHPGRPGRPRWQGKDHWHHNGGKDHLPPGTEVPDPVPPDPTPPEPTPGGQSTPQPDSTQEKSCEVCKDAGKVLGYATFARITYAVVRACVGVVLIVVAP